MFKRIICAGILTLCAASVRVGAEDVIALPSPRRQGDISVEQALEGRKTVRSFEEQPIELTALSQVLWAAGGGGLDGVTGATRTYPSAGGIYPLGLYVVAGDVSGLDPGIYQYLWKEHALRTVETGDFRGALAEASLRQGFVARAAAIIVITADFRRTERKYGKRGRERYVALDAGHASQSLHLQAVGLGLATATVGAFSDEQVKTLLGLEDEQPLLVIPVGRALSDRPPRS